MKFRLLFILLMGTALPGFAQTNLNGFGGLLVQAAPLDGDWRPHIGAGGAVLVNRSFYAGIYGMSMVGNIERTLINSNTNQEVAFPLNFLQGGLWLGYFVNPDNKLQVTINSLGGAGVITTTLEGKFGPDRVFLVSPYLGLQYAAATFMRIELAAGYRVVAKDNNLEFFENGGLSAPFAGLHLRFGGFD
jgi:hypothetical protein